MMIILGYTLAVMMGMTLGIVGAGGSILTTPILVYILGIKPMVATGYSLLIVGSAALAGAASYWRKGLVNISAALIFAMPAMLSVLATRALIMPAIPDPLFGAPKDALIMLLFALLMIVAAIFMLKKSSKIDIVDPHPEEMNAFYALKLVLGSVLVGLLSGLVGAGGGFLIIPTLITLFRLPIKEAIATSLTVIAINSFVGFSGDLANGIPLNWHLLLPFLSLTLFGIWLGTNLGKKMQAQKLKKLFGVLTALFGLAIFTKEILSVI